MGTRHLHTFLLNQSWHYRKYRLSRKKLAAKKKKNYGKLLYKAIVYFSRFKQEKKSYTGLLSSVHVLGVA